MKVQDSQPAAESSHLNMECVMAEHGDRIFRLCLLYMGNRTLAEDAFQETMLKCWQAYPTYRGEAAFATWLSHIAVNVCRDMLRSRWFWWWKTAQPEETMMDVPAPEGENMDVKGAVMRLPTIYREVVVLTYYENLTAKEIGEMLSLSPNTVSTRLRRGRAMLAQQWKEDEDDEG